MESGISQEITIEGKGRMKVSINLDEVFLMLPSCPLLSLIVNAHSEQDEDSYLINNENS